MIEVLAPLGIGFGLAAALTPLFLRMARGSGIVAYPAADRWHRRQVPLLGGAAVYSAFLIALFLTGPVGGGLLAVLAGGTILFVLGLVDDVKRLRPSTKLVGQVVAASVLVGLGVEARFTDHQIVTIPLTILWVVGITNAFNLIDNMDGLCAGVGTLAALALGAYALRWGDAPFPGLVRLAFGLAGAQAGFLLYNVNPAKVFLGDAGALFIGFVLASGAIMGTYEHAGNLFLILAVPVFVLGVPIFDTAFVTIVRKFHRRRISEGGKDHLSHRLVALGVSERNAVFILWGICGALAGIGVAMSYLDLLANLFLMGVALVAVVIFAIFLGEVAIYRTATTGEGWAAGLELRKTFLNYLRGTALVLLDLLLVCLAYLAAYLVFFEGDIPVEDRERLLESLPILIVMKSVFLHVFRVYQGLWRYFGVRDLLAIFWATVFGSAGSVLGVVLFFRFNAYSRAVFGIDAMVFFLLVAGSRFLFRALLESRRFPSTGKRVLVLGADDRGELCLRALRTRPNGDGACPVGILTADPAMIGRKILGIRVIGPFEDLERLATETAADEIVLAKPLPRDALDDLRARCEALGLPLYLAPMSREFVRL